jgi:tetratricopeptide (TPR) repeat protein
VNLKHEAMKKIVLPVLFMLSYTAVAGQTIDEGRSHYYYERYQSAEDHFQKLTQQQASNAEAWYWLTASHLRQNETQQAYDNLQKAPQEVKNQPFYHVAQGATLLAMNKPQDAANHFNMALDQTKEKDPAILAAVANAHIEIKQGDANYAIQLLERAIKRDKRDANLNVLLGNAYRKLDNGTEAYKAYQEALQKNERLAAAYYQLGNIFVTQKNADVYLDYFDKALKADPAYAPVYYRLYMHHFYTDANKAYDYFKKYAALTDKTVENEYALADLLYLRKQYSDAIAKADALINKEGEKVQPRMYKLLAYSYQGMKDSVKAIEHMQTYFAKEADSNHIAKDFETMADLLLTTGQTDSAITYYELAASKEKDSASMFGYYKKLADLSASLKNYDAQAKYLGIYNKNNPRATNLDLFYWGLAHFRGENYKKADSVFSLYIEKYPEQGFGYYWKAKSNVLLDPEMKEGLAVPHYTKLVEVIGDKTEDETNKKWLVESYAYLAAYEANVHKDYKDAIGYFEKLLEVDSENEDAKKYIAILEKNLDDGGK